MSSSMQWRMLAAFASGSGAVDIWTAMLYPSPDPLIFGVLVAGGLVGLGASLFWWIRASRLATRGFISF